MLQFTKAQMEQIDENYRKQFAAEVRFELQKDYPERWQVLPEELADRLVKDRMDEAFRRYGMESCSGLTLYLYLMTEVGAGFDQQNDIALRLGEDGEADEAIQMLMDELSDEAWEEAEQGSTIADWFRDTRLPQIEQVAIRSCWALSALQYPIPTEEDALMAWLSPWVNQAISYDITDARGQTAAVMANALLGDNFYQRPDEWIQTIFTDKEILPVLRGFTLANCIESMCEISI